MLLARTCVPAVLAVLTSVLVLGRAAALGVPAPSGSVDGAVVDTDGVAIVHARVSLADGRATIVRVTDAHGAFHIDSLAPDTYVLSASAPGFADVGGRLVGVAAGAVTVVSVEMSRSTNSLTTLGRVVTRGSDAVSTSSAPVAEVDAQTYAARGAASIMDLIGAAGAPSTIIRPAGGNPASPAAVALRGPDPTETLFDIDGHALNSGGSGSFDASLLDPAQLAAVELVYGVAPASLVGPNTIGGAVNVRTLDPTPGAHGLYRVTAGSFDTFGETLTATGTSGGVGYATSLHRQTTRGETALDVRTQDGSAASVGSAIAAGTALGKVRVGLGTRGGSLQLTVRDQSAFRDLSAALSPSLDGGGGPFVDFSGTASLTHNAAYGVDVVLPLGRAGADAAAPATLAVRHLTTLTDQSVVGPGAGINPFLNEERDGISDDIIELDRTLSTQELSLKIDVRSETLTTTVTPAGVQDQAVVRPGFAGADAAAPGSVTLDQIQRSLAVRYTLDAPAKLHYALAVYASDFSSFGSSVDPRFSVVWAPNAQTSVRASIGTTFQSPQLPELYVPPVLPPPDADGFFHIGNPHLTADRATDLDVGIDHIFSGAYPAHATVDAYRSDVRNTSVPFVPALNCAPSGGPPPPPQQCEAFPINAGGARYQGLEFGLARQIARAARARASYAVNDCYPTAIPIRFQNGTLVDGEQFLGVPLQSGAFEVTVDPSPAFDYEAGMRYEGAYNELHRPPFVTLQAGATFHAGHLDVGIFGTNLTDVYDDLFTRARQGVPYAGLNGAIATDAFPLAGRAISLVLTTRY